MMSILRTSLSIAVAVIAICSFDVHSQDLGSSNKLFGQNKAKSSRPKTKPGRKPQQKSSTKRSAGSGRKVTGERSKRRPRGSAAQGRSTAVPPTTARGLTPVKIAPRTPIDKDRYEDLIERGNSARNDRMYPDAESAYQSAQKVDPSDARAFLGLGNLYSDQQRWEFAEREFRKALSIDKDNVDLLTALSFILTRPLMAPNISERYAEAEVLARRAIKLAPGNALAYDQLGVSLEFQGRNDSETENAYRRSIQLDRDFAPAYAHLARLRRKQGRTSEANSAYRDAATKAITVGSKLLVADVMHSDQRYVDSLPILDLALRLDSKNPTALAMLGRTYTVLGRFADAERDLRRLIEVAPSSSIGYELLSSLQLRQGRLDDAETTLLRAIPYLAPFERRRVASQFEYLGDALSRARRPDNAQRCYRQARSLDAERETLKNKLART